MSDYERVQIIRNKRHQLRNLLLARERVKRLERELRGDPVQPEEASYVPQYLRAVAGSPFANSPASAVPYLRDETAALVTKAMNAWGRHRPAQEVPVTQRLRLVEDSNARVRQYGELQSESGL